MKVISLEISKRSSYDEYPNEIVGTVQMQSDTGKMEVRLTPKTVCEIFSICRDSVQKVANFNASQASEAIENASSQLALQAENNDLKQLEG